MLFTPSPLFTTLPDQDALKADRRSCLRFGPCGTGKQALYIGGRYIERRFYIPWKDVRRVFKRVAMSKNGFSGKGVFGSMAFLVVQYGNGKEKECPFKIETDVDRLLAEVEQSHPGIPTHSAAAEKKLKEAEAAEEARYLKHLPQEVSAVLKELEEDQEYLNQRPALSDMLTAAAKQKRIVDKMPPAVRILGVLFAALSLAAVLFGLWGLFTHNSLALYFIIGGAAVFFMVLSANALPGKYNSKEYALREWNDAVNQMQTYLSERPGFAVPPQYAHPVVLTRMMRVLKEGRAETRADALETVKADLKALNSSVTVSQKEHDEVVAVKPLFLVCDYQDRI